MKEIGKGGAICDQVCYNEFVTSWDYHWAFIPQVAVAHCMFAG